MFWHAGHAHVAEALGVPIHIFFTMPWTWVLIEKFPFLFIWILYLLSRTHWFNHAWFFTWFLGYVTRNQIYLSSFERKSAPFFWCMETIGGLLVRSELIVTLCSWFMICIWCMANFLGKLLVYTLCFERKKMYVWSLLLKGDGCIQHFQPQIKMFCP